MVVVINKFPVLTGTKRVNGNRKGMLTHTRQPKASAHLLRRRYHSLARKLDNATIARPADSDTHLYVSSWFARSPQGAGKASFVICYNTDLDSYRKPTFNHQH
uniref:Uncharacterized protein n=1 Tax=Timema genevievae TaxID=629358 RepID=A0A7R9K3D8_TIMGE|nr:unnamed protein product [Timema genevievae]